jgi:hypothetical protein
VAFAHECAEGFASARERGAVVDLGLTIDD